jgi:hypothetical protein
VITLMPCLEQEFIQRELHQHVVPEMRVLHPVGGEDCLGAVSQHRQGLVGPRGTPVDQLSSSLPLLVRTAALLAGACVRLTPGLFRLDAPFPRG